MWERVRKYLYEVRGELRKVVWPTRQQTSVFTLVVILSVLFIAMLIWAVDSVLGGVMQWLFQL